MTMVRLESRWGRAAVVAAALLLAAGCGGGEEELAETSSTPVAAPAGPSEVAGASGVPAPASTPSPTATATPEPVPSATDDDGTGDVYPSREEIEREGTAASCDLLGGGWCADSNGNGWPDALEELAGRDPAVDACGAGECGAALAEFEAYIDTNTVFALDASGSMAGDAGGGVDKMTAARQALVEYVRGTPELVDQGLVVYGHRGDNSDAGKPESCAGVEAFAPVGELGLDNVEQVVGQFSATGWTPIAAALDATGPLLVEAAEADRAEGVEDPGSRVILISDGIETCGGDPVASARALQELGIEVVVDVIGFDVGEADAAALRQVADVTGGAYYDASSGQALREVLAQFGQQVHDNLHAAGCVQVEANRDQSCQLDLANSILDVLYAPVGGLVGEAIEGDQARGDFLRDWVSVLDEERREARLDDARAGQERLAEALDQLNEAIARDIEAGRGKRVSFVVPPCWGVPAHTA